MMSAIQQKNWVLGKNDFVVMEIYFTLGSQETSDLTLMVKCEG